MVFKVIQMSTFEAARWIAALSVISAFIWSVGGFIALLLWSSYKDELITTAGLATKEDVLRLQETLSEAAESFSLLSRQIVVLSRPENVTIYRESPKPIDGACSVGETCRISIFAERSPRATECRIIPNLTELLILIKGREYVATPSPNRQAINLQLQPRALEPAFILPQGIPIGRGTAIIRTHYAGCSWQIDGQPPVVQDSPAFEIETTGP